jgi:hypothetical protein
VGVWVCGCVCGCGCGCVCVCVCVCVCALCARVCVYKWLLKKKKGSAGDRSLGSGDLYIRSSDHGVPNVVYHSGHSVPRTRASPMESHVGGGGRGGGGAACRIWPRVAT